MTESVTQNPAIEQSDNQKENSELELIKNEIRELSEDKADNDKVEIDKKLNAEFFKNLKPEEVNSLLTSITALEGAKWWETNIPDSVRNLKNMLLPLVNPINNMKWNGDLDDPWEKKWDFFNKIGERVKDLQSEIGTLVSEIDEIKDDRLNNIKDILGKVQKVLENPSDVNTNILQKFLYTYLSDSDKLDFEKYNSKKPDATEFDWKFWQNTFKRLNQFIDRAKKYVTEVEKSKESEGERDKLHESLNAPMTKKRIVEILKLAKVENTDKNSLWLPKSWSDEVYSKEWKQWYYYFDWDYIIFMPLWEDNKISSKWKKRKMADYKEWESEDTWEEYEISQSWSVQSAAEQDRPDVRDETHNTGDSSPESWGEYANLNEIILSTWLMEVDWSQSNMSNLWFSWNEKVFVDPDDMKYYYYITSDHKLARVSDNYFDWYSVLDTSKYTKWMKLNSNENMWINEGLRWYPPVNEVTRRYLENLLRQSIKWTRLEWSSNEVIIQNNKYRVESFGYDLTIAADTFNKWWLFDSKTDKNQLKKDMRMISLVNYFMKNYKWKVNWCQFYLKDWEELRLRWPNIWDKSIISKREWRRDYWKFDSTKSLEFTNYINKCTWGVVLKAPTLSSSSEWEKDVPPQALDIQSINKWCLARDIHSVWMQDNFSALLVYTYNKAHSVIYNNTLQKTGSDRVQDLQLLSRLSKWLTTQPWEIWDVNQRLLWRSVSTVWKDTYEALIKHFWLENDQKINIDWNVIKSRLNNADLWSLSSVKPPEVVIDKNARQKEASHFCDELRKSLSVLVSRGSLTNEDLLSFDAKKDGIIRAYVNDSNGIMSFSRCKLLIIDEYNKIRIKNSQLSDDNLNKLSNLELPSHLVWFDIPSDRVDLVLSWIEGVNLIAQSYNEAFKWKNSEDNLYMLKCFIEWLSSSNDAASSRMFVAQLQQRLHVVVNWFFNLPTIEAFINHFWLQNNNEIQTTLNNIKESIISLDSGENKLEKAKQYCENLRNNLLNQDLLTFSGQTESIVNSYVKNLISFKDFKKNIDKVYADMPKHYSWWNNYKYSFVWKEMKDKRPFGSWIVKFIDDKFGEQSFEWKWDENWNLVECSSFGNSIEINYNEQWIPYFEVDGIKLKIDETNISDVWKVAHEINRMTSEVNKLKDKWWSLTRINSWFSRLGASFQKYDDNLTKVETSINLVSDMKNVLFVKSMTTGEITNWFKVYFSKKIS